MPTNIYDSKYFRQYVKPDIREITQSSEKVLLSFDDPTEEKHYSDESESIYCHYDRTVDRSVKKVTFLTAFVGTGGIRLPCVIQFVRKEGWDATKKLISSKEYPPKPKMNCSEKCFMFVHSSLGLII